MATRVEWLQYICLSVFLIFSFWFVYADSTCQNLEQWGRGWRRLRPKATLRFLVQQLDPESKSKVSGMERSQSASRKLLGGAPPAGFRGPRNHRPCKCSRGRGASQSARSGHDQNWSFRKTNLIPCVVVIVACPRCSHLKFCHLKSGSSGSTVIVVLALQMALTILTVLMVFDMWDITSSCIDLKWTQWKSTANLKVTENIFKWENL